MTLDVLCEAAFQGDAEVLRAQLSGGFHGDVNLPFTNVNALHMAAMAGQTACVELLLEAKANPLIKEGVPCDKDSETGESARDKAIGFGHNALAEILLQAEKNAPAPPPIKKHVIKEQDAPVPTSSVPKAAAKATAAPKSSPSGQDTLPIALCFPGQGSQYVKMLSGVKDLPEVKDMLEKAKPILGYDLLELCLQGPEDKLAETRYCQPAMFVAGLAGVAKLRIEREEAVSKARCCAGLSLGEYTALCFAGVLSFEDGLRLVKLRGEAMQEAASVGKQAMLSVIGLERDLVDKLCEESAKAEGASGVCKVANYLFPKGFSCAGTQEAIKTLEAKATKANAMSVKPLKTSGGFHTSLMQPAAEKLAQALEETLPKMSPPRCAVYSNVTAVPLEPGTDPKVIVELLKQQLTSSVLWSPSVERMIHDGVDEFYECGPMKQITAMMKRIDPKAWKKTKTTDV